MTDTAAAPVSTDVPVIEGQEIDSLGNVTQTPEPVQVERFEFVKDKYRKEGRSEQEAAYEQAKAYLEAEKRLGGFTGAPEDYQLVVSDDMKAAGVDIDPEDITIKSMMDFAKRTNMSQESFNEFISEIAKNEIAKEEASKAEAAEAIKQLGVDGQKRIENINAVLKSKLDEASYQGLIGSINSIEAIKGIEALIASTRNAPVNPSSVSSAPTITKAEVQAMQFEKDQFGQRRIHSDPAFAAEFERKAALVYGTEPYKQIVG